MKYLALIASLFLMSSPLMAEENGGPVKEVVLIDALDQVQVSIEGRPDLTAVYEVDPSGETTFPIIGRVHAQWLSLEELREFLAKKLSEAGLESPQISVAFKQRYADLEKMALSTDAFKDEAAAEVPVISAGDELNIEVKNEKDLTGIYKVNADGVIPFPLLGEVYIEGLTLDEVKSFVRDSLAKDYLVDPEVNVIFFQTPKYTAQRVDPNQAIEELARATTKKDEPAPPPSPAPAPEAAPTPMPPQMPYKEPVVSLKQTLATAQAVTEAIQVKQRAEEAEKAEAAPEPRQAPRPDIASFRVSELSVIEAGDKLGIQVYREPDLSGNFTVTSVGKINYPLLGEIYAAGLTLEELRTFLTNRLSESYLVNPQIDISFIESPSKSVAVLGQVAKPGIYILQPEQTLLRLITQIGGFTAEANTRKVRVMRTFRNGKKATIPINVDKIIEGKDNDVALAAGDLLFVDVKPPVEEKKPEKLPEIKANKYITVLGQAAKPGNYFYKPNMTLMRIIGEAGGFAAAAAPNRIKIVRAAKGVSLVVDARQIMAGRVKDLEVMEGDMIIVPETYF